MLLDEESILETLHFMRKIPLDDFHFTIFTPLPGTSSYRIADQYGTFDKTWSKMNLQNPVFVPDGLTAEQMEYFLRGGAYRHRPGGTQRVCRSHQQCPHRTTDHNRWRLYRGIYRIN